jgi:hypothetical protein
MVRLPSRFALALAFCAAVPAFAVAEESATDLIGGFPVLEFRADGPFQNPLVGGRAEVELRRLGGALNIALEGGYSFNPGEDDYPVLPLFGCAGARARAAAGFTFATKTESVRTFNPVTVIASDANSTTYLGYYFNKPVHQSHSAELDLLLEPTGVLRAVRNDPDTLAPVYEQVPGYSLFVFPRYRYVEESHYSLGGSDKSAGSFISMALGPMFTPDFRRVGGAVEMGLSTSGSGLGFWLSVMCGFVARTDRRADMIFADPDDREDILEPDDEMIDLMLGYFPMRMSLGASYSIPLGKGGIK